MSKLIVKDVTFSYDQENIIEDINIELHDNELVCLLGSSGGGKTTLFITHDIDEAILLSDRICLLTGKPGRITEEIAIKEPKPRRKDFNLTEEFLEYKRQIIEKL